MRSSALPPGPRLPPTAQALWWAYRPFEFSRRVHGRYGPTFTARLGGLPPAVVTVDRDAIRRLFTGDPLSKRHGNDLLRPFVGERAVMVLEPAAHLARRKLLLPSFHGESVRAYAALMRQLVEEELEKWGAGREVRVMPVAENLTLEVILRAVLGMSDPAMRRRLHEHYEAMLAVPGSSIGWYFPKLASRRNPLVRHYWRLKDELDALLATQIAATRADPELGARDDVLALLVQARDEAGAGLDDDELRDELNALLVAGHETTATAIAWAAELLAHDRDVQERARAAVADDDEDYLDALVKEVLRLYPPTLIGASRFPLEPFPIGNFTVAPGVSIAVNAHGLHRDPSIYPEPQRLRPERFLDSPPESYAYLPFGGGAHRCLGASLAQLEMRVVLSALIARFDLVRVEREISAPVRRATLIAPRGGGRVRLARVRVRTAAATAPA
ncbi:MAG: cytochrome family [Solirubrobacteraceae bacterium]|jgi:cytochrome P450|nr:cytochrome family [Solirubrobacteraceae bacterium]